jgi:DNA-binding MarR family transcriptional regulator
MATRTDISRETTLHVGKHCLCLHAQRAARTLARRFDEAFKPLDITNKQFSLMMALNRPKPPTMGSVARELAMDRTTLTAALKPLERRGLLEVVADEQDRRARVTKLTPSGRRLLARAVPVWMAHHAEIERLLRRGDADRMRADLRTLAQKAAPDSARSGA